MLITLCACSNTEDDERNNLFDVTVTDEKSKDDFYTKLLKSSSLPPRQSQYKMTQPLYSKGDDITGFVAYNDAHHSLDWFILQEDSIVFDRETKLILEGPGKVENIRAFYVHNVDSIFMKSRNYLYIIDQIGKQKYKFSVATNGENSVIGLDLNRYQPSANQKEGKNIYFRDNEIYIPLNYYAVSEHNDLAGFADSVLLLCSFNIKSEEFKPLPISYPDVFRKGLYGYMSKLNMHYSGNNIIYSFTGFSEIYKYSIDSYETMTITNRSFNPPNPINGDDKYKHLNSHIHFEYNFISYGGSVLYQYIFYPFDPSVLRPPKLRVTNLNNRESYIYALPERIGAFGSFSSKENIFIPRVSTEEETLEYYKIKLNY
jgi:hypothetical protein